MGCLSECRYLPAFLIFTIMKSILPILFLFPIYLMGQHLHMILQSASLQKPVEVDLYLIGDDPQYMVFLTDGKKLLDHEALPTLEKLTERGSIPPAYYVFVSTVHPETGEDHRNEYFFCNEHYLHFFEEELIPTVEEKIKQSFSPKNRSLIGISFGGLNAAYFSAHSPSFKKYGLLSPITYPRKEVFQDITFSTQTDLKIYLSTGKDDAERYVKSLHATYQQKDYKLQVVETEGEHDFQNWNSQWEQLLRFLLLD